MTNTKKTTSPRWVETGPWKYVLLDITDEDENEWNYDDRDNLGEVEKLDHTGNIYDGQSGEFVCDGGILECMKAIENHLGLQVKDFDFGW